MKYLGEKSLSSFLSGLLRISWHITIACTIFIVVILSIILFVPPVTDAEATGFSQANYLFFQEITNDQEVVEIHTLPMAAKIFILPYLIAVVILLLSIIKRAHQFFLNLKQNIVFDPGNVTLLRVISKLVIVFSIMTFSFSSLLLGLILFIVCEIFKNGTVLQEEHDYTV
ncbi:MAG: DUF2975 domain-containing protein [Fibrobacterales bacterium]